MIKTGITRLMVLGAVVLFGCLGSGSAQGELFVRFLFNEFEPGADPNNSNIANSGHGGQAEAYDAIIYTNSVQELHATYIASPGDTALHLDGASTQLILFKFPDVPSNVLPPDIIDGGMTIAYWLRFEATSEVYMSLLTTAQSTTPSSQIQHYLKAVGSAPYLNRVFVNPADTPAGNETQINSGQWHHLVWTYETDPNTQKFYVDGVLQYTDVNKTITVGGTTSTRFGVTFTSSYVRPFSGDLDQVEVYDNPLNGTEVSDLYNSGAYVRLTGHEWTRANPALIAGILVSGTPSHQIDTPEEIGDYFDARFNYFSYFDSSDRVTLDLARSVDPNCPVYMWSGTDQGIRAYYGTYGVGLPTIVQRRDEPHRSAFESTNNSLNYLRGHYPDYLIMCNANPSTANSGDATYFTDFMDAINSDVLMSDRYPCRLLGFTDFGYFLDILIEMQKVAIVKDVPLWFWIQSETRTASYTAINGRLPSETDLRMLMFSAMTFGVVGFNYLSYAHWTVPAIIDAEGVKTHTYQSAKNTNIEVRTLIETLKFTKPLGTFYVPGQPSNTVPQYNGPIDLDIWSSVLDPDDYILDVSIDENDAAINGLIGFFNADDGQKYFMICNLNSGQYISPTEGEVTFRVQFDGTVSSLLRLNRKSGVEEVVTLTGNELVDVLPGGTGNLYKYNNGTSFLSNWAGPEYFCNDVLERGYGLANDFDNNCFVDVYDLLMFLQEWMSCVEVAIPSCDHPWQ